MWEPNPACGDHGDIEPVCAENAVKHQLTDGPCENRTVKREMECACTSGLKHAYLLSILTLGHVGIFCVLGC